MDNISLKELSRLTRDLLIAAGMGAGQAETVTEIYMRSTLRGVGHHDIYSLPGRVEAMRSGKINPRPQIEKLSGIGACAVYSGDNGPGELLCAYITDRACELADHYGIGLCAVRDSNHFLGSAPYVQRAADRGYLAMVFTRAEPGMGTHALPARIMGNNPMGFASPAGEDQIMLDVCCAYASYGELSARMKRGEAVPEGWGLDKDGADTRDPGAILQGGVPLAMAEHKGFGLALLIELLTGALTGGQVIDEKNEKFGSGGTLSHTAIVIKPGAVTPDGTFSERVKTIGKRLRDKRPDARLPGQRSNEVSRLLAASGDVALRPEFVERLNALAQQLQVRGL